MSIYKEHESKPQKTNVRPNLATPEDLDREYGTVLALIEKSRAVIRKSEEARLAGRPPVASDVIRSARAVERSFHAVSRAIQRYEKALAAQSAKTKKVTAAPDTTK